MKIIAVDDTCCLLYCVLIFLSQSSSIEFLASQGFDFNKVFRDGVSSSTPNTANVASMSSKSSTL